MSRTVEKHDELSLRKIRLYEVLSIGLDRIMVGKNIVASKTRVVVISTTLILHVLFERGNLHARLL